MWRNVEKKQSEKSSVWRTVRTYVGFEELGFVVSLGLIAFGLWDAYRPAAWFVPGAALLWTFLPPRLPFFEKPKVEGSTKRQRSR